MVEEYDLIGLCVKMPYSKEVLEKCSEFSCGNLIYEVPADEPLQTRMMYFDLKKL